MQHKMVPQSRERVQTREPEKRIRQISVNVLGGLEYRRVFWDPEIKVEEAEVKNAPMVNEGHETEDWDYEHQRIESQVHRV